MCILLGLVQPGSDIKLFTKLLVFNFMSFPAGAPRQLLGTHRSFQVAPHLMYLCLAVVSCPVFCVVYVVLLCPVRILYLCDQQYPVGSHGGLSSLIGFDTAGVRTVRFSTSLMSFRFCAWRLAMKSVRVLLAMTIFSNVSLLWNCCIG